MYKIMLSLLILASVNLSAYSDYDMDGVSDKSDKCPNTPMSELVDINGCTTKTLNNPHHFDIIFGINYSQSNYNSLEKADTTTGSLQVDYYYKNFSIQASTAYYDSQSATYNDSGANDSFLGAYYTLYPVDKLKIKLGAGAIIPTYKSKLNNNKTDYTSSINLSYMLSKVNIFGGYNYTLINDNDTINVKYQNTNSYSAGLGVYPMDKLYLSASFNSSDSIYKGVKNVDVASIYAFYNINTNWFTTFNYAYGLSKSASDNYYSLRLGYYF